jgi:sugar/nucleoside kinase (ribokinase family)
LHTLDQDGAGDAFDAAWCMVYAQTNSAEQASQRANKLYARVAAHHGSRPRVDLRGMMPSSKR